MKPTDDEDLFELTYEEQLAETDHAILLLVPSGDEVWIPRSQIIEHLDDAVRIPAWLAEQKGLD